MGRPIVIYAVPIAAAQALQLAAATVALAVLGGLGTDALGAAAAPLALLTLALSLFAPFATGVMIGIARANAAGDRVRVQQLIAQGLSFALGAGGAGAVFGVVFAPALVHAVNVPEPSIALATPYLQLVALSLPGTFLSMMYGAVLEALGKRRAALGVLCGCTFLYLVGLFTLRFGALAVPTAALASSLIVSIGTAVALYVRHEEFRFEIPPADFIPNLRRLVALLRFDASVSVQYAAVALADVAILSIAYDYGARGGAAYILVLLAIAYLAIPGAAFGTAVSAAPRLLRSAFIYYAWTAGMLTFAAYVLAPPLLNALTVDPQTAAAARAGIFTIAWSTFALGAANLISAELEAHDDGVWPCAVAITGIWLVLLPCARLFTMRWGMDGIWYAYALGYSSIAVVQIGIAPFLLRRQKAERQQVTAAPDRTFF